MWDEQCNSENFHKGDKVDSVYCIYKKQLNTAIFYVYQYSKHRLISKLEMMKNLFASKI